MCEITIYFCLKKKMNQVPLPDSSARNAALFSSVVQEIVSSRAQGSRHPYEINKLTVSLVRPFPLRSRNF